MFTRQKNETGIPFVYISMKMIWIALIMLLPCHLQAQTILAFERTPGAKRITKLVIDARDSHSFAGNDSSGNVIIDTLIMKDRSRLLLYNKKKFSLTIMNAFIGKRCVIAGTDGKNNGTNLNLAVNFEELETLTINVSGLDANNGTRTFPNGNGGKLNFEYLDSGIKPQFKDRKKNNYVALNTRAGGYRVTPQSDLYGIFSRIGGGRGRPLGQLPQGQIYSGSIGRDGKTDIKEVTDL